MWKMIGLAAATLTMFSFVPQVIKIRRTKSAKDVSILTILQLTAGVTLWIAYGLHLGDPIIVIANTVTLVTLVAAILLYARYRHS